jgi:hypothetical protein
MRRAHPMAEYRDYCRVHGEPMWHWPAGDEWACQRPECDETQPVHFAETSDARVVIEQIKADVTASMACKRPIGDLFRVSWS